MATSQNPDASRRRPLVGDRSDTGAVDPPGADPTPARTTEHHPTGHGTNQYRAKRYRTDEGIDEHSRGHANVRGTLRQAGPLPTPATGDRPHPRDHDDNPPRHHGGTTVRDVDDPAIDAALDAVVDAAPPLPYDVRARLAWLLRGQPNQQPNRRHHTAA